MNYNKCNLSSLYGHTMVGKGIKFERIRRITGYLTGSVDRWNTAKRSEEQDRIKHTMEVQNVNRKEDTR